MKLEIGSTVWLFDINRRVYRKGPDGRSAGGGPIWREHWVPQRIVSETSRSWVTNYGMKIAKSGPTPHGMALCEEDINRRAWVEENRHKIVDSIYGIADYDTLRKVAEIIGYSESC